MARKEITFTDKEPLNINPTIPDKNKVVYTDMNDLKGATNEKVASTDSSVVDYQTVTPEVLAQKIANNELVPGTLFNVLDEIQEAFIPNVKIDILYDSYINIPSEISGQVATFTVTKPMTNYNFVGIVRNGVITWKIPNNLMAISNNDASFFGIENNNTFMCEINNANTLTPTVAKNRYTTIQTNGVPIVSKDYTGAGLQKIIGVKIGV